MEKDDFRAYLVFASYYAIQVAKRYVRETLPYEFVYDVELNQSMDEGCDKEFVCYPEDEDKVYLQQDVEKIVTLLVRDDRVPVWIDINVKSATTTTTTFRLLCAGRFTNRKERMYYSARGQGPFGIKSPHLPVGWKEGEKFYLATKNNFLVRLLQRYKKSHGKMGSVPKKAYYGK